MKQRPNGRRFLASDIMGQKSEVGERRDRQAGTREREERKPFSAGRGGTKNCGTGTGTREAAASKSYHQIERESDRSASQEECCDCPGRVREGRGFCRKLIRPGRG
jgi:hypothetical protein